MKVNENFPQELATDMGSSSWEAIRKKLHCGAWQAADLKDVEDMSDVCELFISYRVAGAGVLVKNIFQKT